MTAKLRQVPNCLAHPARGGSPLWLKTPTALGQNPDSAGSKPRSLWLKTPTVVLPLEGFFKVLIFGDDIELRNRFLKIGQEYGTKSVEAIADLHRHNVVVNDGVNRSNDVINVGINHVNDVINDVIKFTASEEIAVKTITRNPRLSAMKLADLIGVKQRQAQRIIASLKKKAGLKRRGARKNGEWYFE